MTRAAAAAAVAALAAAGCGGSSGDTGRAPAVEVRLGWHEIVRLDGRPLLEITVRSVRFETRSWSVRASVHNLGAKTLTIERSVRQYPNWFGLAPSPTRDGATPVERPRIHHAETATPELPGELPPGATWRGTFSGLGVVRPGWYLRVTFGMFGGATPHPFGWLSDHVFQVPQKP